MTNRNEKSQVQTINERELPKGLFKTNNTLSTQTIGNIETSCVIGNNAYNSTINDTSIFIGLIALLKDKDAVIERLLGIILALKGGRV